MSNDTDGLKPSDLADMLALQSVTVRKYALQLESAGYIFKRTQGGQRIYTEQDAMVFQQLKSLRDRSGLSIENAASLVVDKLKKASEGVAIVENTGESLSLERYDERYVELAEKFAFLEQIPQIVDELGQLRKENVEIKTLMDNRDKMLLQTLHEMKQEVAATHAENADLRRALDERLSERDRKLTEALTALREQREELKREMEQPKKRSWWPFGK